MAQQPRESTVGPQTPETEAAVDSFRKILSELSTPERRSLRSVIKVLTDDFLPTIKGKETKKDAAAQSLESTTTSEDFSPEPQAEDDAETTSNTKPRKPVTHSAPYQIGKAVSNEIAYKVRKHPDGGNDIVETKPASVSSKVSELSISEKKGKIKISAHLEITMFSDTKQDENSEPTNCSSHSASNH